MGPLNKQTRPSADSISSHWNHSLQIRLMEGVYESVGTGERLFIQRYFSLVAFDLVMKRREIVFSAASLSALSGCLGLGSQNEGNIVSLTDSSLTTDDISCQSSLEEQATVAVSESQVTVEGVFPATGECTDLALSLKAGVDPQTEGQIDVEIEEIQETAGDCHSCVPRIEYTATVDISQQPTVINVQHFPLTEKPTQPAQWQQGSESQ